MTKISRRAAFGSVGLLAFAGLPARSAAAPIYTGDFLNGRCWAELSETEKVMFVSGFSEGVTAFSGSLEGGESGSWSQAHKDAVLFFSTPNFTIGDAVKEISRLYEEPANSAIPVSFLYPVAVSVFKGLPSAALEDQLLALRDLSQKLEVSK